MAITLVGGGARSGKSAYAQRLAEAAAPRGVYVATAEAGDDEMAARIARHRAERGRFWRTVEAPLELAAGLERLEAEREVAVVVDCLTLWLSNTLLAEDRDEEQESLVLFTLLNKWKGPDLVLVTNEVGMGIVPDTALGRRFRDLAGRLNQDAAAAADRVVWMLFGCPFDVKSLKNAP